MRCRLLIAAMASLLLLTPVMTAAGEEASGYAAHLERAGFPLQFCGSATVKAYRLFKVARSALYRIDCSLPWSLGRKETRFLQFDYLREVPAHAFRESAMAMLQRNLALSPEQQRILEQFHQAYRAVDTGDRYALLYTPKSGLTLYLNGQILAKLQDEWLASHYFAIWLGEKPFDDRLKHALLGCCPEL